MAMQLHGGGGLSDDFPLAAAWISARSLRLADGPDEVHRGVVARLELGKYDADEGPRHRRRLRARRRAGRGASPARGDEVLAADLSAARRPGRRAVDDSAVTAGSTSPPTTTGPRRSPGSRSTGAGSTCWSTTPASPAAAGSTWPTLDEWQWITEINLFGVVRGTRTFVPMFKAQRPAGSSTSPRSPGWCTRPGWAPTTRSRPASSRSPRPLGHELAAYGVRAHVGLPVVLPDQPDGLAARRRRRRWRGVIAQLVESSPITADDIAAAVLAGHRRAATS